MHFSIIGFCDSFQELCHKCYTCYCLWPCLTRRKRCSMNRSRWKFFSWFAQRYRLIHKNGPMCEVLNQAALCCCRCRYVALQCGINRWKSILLSLSFLLTLRALFIFVFDTHLDQNAANGMFATLKPQRNVINGLAGQLFVGGATSVSRSCR